MTQDKILVIDDEKATLKMFRLFLDVYGFDIMTAESGEEGLEVFDREKPDIVLTDIKMPGMDGIEVLQEIKKRSPATEVIVITGHGDMDLAIQALNLDAADFINKPIQRQSLEQGLARARERLKLAKSRQNEVAVRTQGSALVIEIQGSVSSHSEPYLREAYAKARAAEVKRIVLHFDPNTSVNGAGIAILTQLVLESEKDGLEIVMAGLSDNFRKVFGIVGLTRMIQIFDTLDQACA
ncbi:MAG: response regulator [Desulfomicrobium sp.]|nr:response regulator [Pseudomonadota bacterium]MBV1713697.1 response regulator [Desulfomicrobium sp.]MBU4572233.1 response regulator [Pseudomonadota bacterium]MBU4594211.1 response regulator [Pseudomonadota bacterium]MBV1721482.1 response regulator [Desulfomicrobium sp.]